MVRTRNVAAGDKVWERERSRNGRLIAQQSWTVVGFDGDDLVLECNGDYGSEIVGYTTFAPGKRGERWIVSLDDLGIDMEDGKLVIT